MKKEKYINLTLVLLSITIIMIYSFLNMYNLQYLKGYDNYLIKQIIWYVIGFISFKIILKNNKINLFKYSFIIYLINIILLILVLFYGTSINGTRAWFNFKYVSIQPSSLMLISLSLYLTRIIYVSKIRNTKDEINLILRCILVTLIPSLLVFLEPDTGNVIMYLIILFVSLMCSSIRKRWLVILCSFIIILITLFFYLYFNNPDLLIKLIGNSFYYRVERLFAFTSNSSLQLENALVSIGSSNILGYPLGKVRLYIPESATDFIMALTISNFGLIGTIIIFISYMVMDICLISLLFKHNKRLKIFISSFLGIFIFSQMENIFMNLGILPIMGIPLPFLSYGGTIIVVYFIFLGIIFNTYLYGT